MNEKRWLILTIVLIGPFMATLDSSIVSVALPKMSSDLMIGINTIQWIVTSYLITISATILVFGRIADIKSKKIIYQYGFLIFSTGSFLCSISENIALLICFRIVQAIGASMIMSCNQGIITDIFPDSERGRALGLSATTVAIGTMAGPSIGGIIVGFFNWKSIFLINIPIGIIAFILGQKILPDEEKKIEEKFDIKGAITFSTAIISLFWSVLSGERIGWSNKWISISLIISILNLFYFYYIEKNMKHPMLDFTLFNNSTFSISIFCAFISYIVIFCTNIIHPFFLQHILNMKPQYAGLFMMTYPITVAIVAPISGYISDKIGSQIITMLGLFITGIGLVLMSFLNIKSSYFYIVLASSVVGFGNGLFQSPNNSIVMSHAPADKLGIVGSINALVRNLGMVFGISLSTALFYNRISVKIGYKASTAAFERNEVFIYAMRFVYVTAAFISIIGVILAFTRINNSENT